MKKTTDAQIKAVARYDAEHSKNIMFKLNKKTDADILKFLEIQENKQGLIKKLLREEIKKMENAKYYYKDYFKNTDYIIFLNEDFKDIGRYEITIGTCGELLFKQTKLPAVSEGQIELVKRSALVSAVLKTEEIAGNDEFLKVVGRYDLTDDQIKNINENLGF